MTTIHRSLTMAAMTSLLLCSGCERQEGETIGPRGGTIVSDDGRFTLIIPAGALDEDVEITLAAVPCERHDALTECYEAGPVGLPLLLPAEVVYTIDETMLQTEGDLVVVVEKEDDWSLLADRRVDSDARVVSASAVFLSSFALVVMD